MSPDTPTPGAAPAPTPGRTPDPATPREDPGLTRTEEPTTPSAGRIYDFLLGGTTWFEVDRQAAERVLAVVPEATDAVHLNRTFLQRAVRTLTGLGIKQFIDVGAGLPTMYNTYETAREVDPDVRVVYVDHDPVVRADSLEILRERGTSPDRVAYIDGDLRDPDGILGHPDTRRLIDFDQPIGHLQIALAHFVEDVDEAASLVRRYLDPSPAGSYIALSHGTTEGQDPQAVARVEGLYAGVNDRVHFRSAAAIERILAGYELLPPYDGAASGLAPVGAWGASEPESVDESGSWILCAIARKP